jgi:inner membrane protein
MASIITHGVVGAAGAAAFAEKRDGARFWILSIALSILSDVDSLGHMRGIRHASAFSHRGLTHSLIFALVISLVTVAVFFRNKRAFSRRSWFLVLYFFGLIALHGVLDSMTTGGSGVAFFYPFLNKRIFLPWRPILVSPLSVRPFFSARGVRILLNEMQWVWAPVSILAVSIRLARRALRRKKEIGSG